MTVVGAYQGIEGSHSQVILKQHFAKRAEDVELIGVPTFRDVAIAVTTGRARFGMLPLDNATSGTFRDGYDLVALYDMVPVREINQRMDQRLLALPGATLAGLRQVHGHPIALDDCERFLATLSAARVVPVTDAGTAARAIAQGGDDTIAVVGPPEAGEHYGLIELAARISDSRLSSTRFLLVEGVPAKERTPPGGGPRRTSMTFRLRNEEGALAKALGALAGASINISKLESRPRPGRAWEYSFYMDIDADVNEPSVFGALEAMRLLCSDFRILGSYDRDDLEEQAPSTTSSARPNALPALPDHFRLATIHGTKTKSMVPPPAAKNWPRAARESRPYGTIVRVDQVEVGGKDFVIIAGPCSVETRDQVMQTAEFVRDHGAVMLRGGAFKPRTSPYAFQGLGWEAVELLREAGDLTGMPIVSEVMSIDQVEQMARSVDVLQIGARNMQNFDLLKAVGKTSKPILLKRGLSATLDELLAAAEYILDAGNPDVILCERGIRTFETATRNTLDLSAVPVLRERTHLPIIVDPSHGVGVRRWIRPLARAAKAVGAHGIIVEVHPNPAVALSDQDQALRFDQFERIVEDIRAIPDFED
jgi:chorismate mutase/prephenate dehydratase